MDQINELLFQYGHIGVFVALLIIGLGLPVPEDIILITGGVISSRDESLLLMNIIGMTGVLLGDSIIYALGYHYGVSILSRRPFRWIVTPERLQKVQAWYTRWGYWTIFVSRFAAGLRASSFLLAGASRVPYRIFLLANGTAALVSVPFFIGVGYYFADHITEVITKMKEIQSTLVWVVLPLLMAYLLYRFVIKPRRAKAALERASSASSLEGLTQGLTQGVTQATSEKALPLGTAPASQDTADSRSDRQQAARGH
ncbi:MAG: DedA family protein [Myxococcota bacterium]